VTVARLISWYRVGSSVWAVVALVVANLIPLVGVLFFGWSVWNILIVYWLENGIVGVFNVLKMSIASGSGVPQGMSMNNRPVAGNAKATLIPFFVIHYGIFWVVHGIFVFTLPFLFTEEPASASGVNPGAILFAGIALAISHGVSFWWNFWHGGEYRRISAAQLMFAPYGRLLVLHMTIILGAVAIGTTGAQSAAVAILVLIKIALDIGLHITEHRRASAPRADVVIVQP
jgi:Family of unknown function (DUF6498)